MSCEDGFNDIFRQFAALDCIIVERSSKVTALRKELKDLEQYYDTVQKKLMQMKSDICSKDKELELLRERRKSQEEQLLLLEAARVELRSKILANETVLHQNKAQHDATLAKYDAIWESYQEKYKSFPLVAERDSLAIQQKRLDIELKVKKQKLIELKRQVGQLKDIRVLHGAILTTEVRALHTKHEDLQAELQNLQIENNEKRCLIRAMKIKQTEEQQRLALEEQSKINTDNLQSKKSILGGPHLEVDLMGDSKLNSITPQDLPDLDIPDFDLGDIEMIQLSCSSSAHDKTSASGVQPNISSGKSLNAMSNNSMHFSTENSAEPFSIMQGPHDNMDNSFEPMNVDSVPSISTGQSAVPTDKELAYPEAFSSNLNSSMSLTPISSIVTASHKKELTIKTDGIVAKLKDLVKEAKAQTTAQEGEGSFIPDISETETNQESDPKQVSVSTQHVFEVVHEQEKGPVLSIKKFPDGNQGQSMEVCDNLPLERNSESSTSKSSYESSNELNPETCGQSENVPFAFNADYDALYDDSSFGPPPNFEVPSASDSEAEACFVSPIMSPAPEDRELQSTIENQSQPYGGFSFFSSSTNIFGGSSCSKIEDQGQASGTFFKF